MADAVIKFISGPLQGSEFTLESDEAVVIGRSDEADLRIADETVSRKHAKLFFINDEIVLEDLSKNGTYVNSQPIKKAVLAHGDLVYIGHSVLKILVNRPAVVPTRRLNTPAPARAIPAKPTLLPLGAAVSYGLSEPISSPQPAVPRITPAPRPTPVGNSTGEHFRGSIGDIAMTDLLQLLSSARKSGVLTLRSSDMIGKIFLEKGRITYATMDDVDPVNPQKVFYRLLRWTTGTFEMTPLDRTAFPRRIEENTDHLLLEAMHELDELNNLGPDLPSLHAEVAPTDPLPSPLKDMASGDLDFIQLAMAYKLVRDILDHYTGTDFEGYTYLKSLLGRGFLRITT